MRRAVPRSNTKCSIRAPAHEARSVPRRCSRRLRYKLCLYLHQNGACLPPLGQESCSCLYGICPTHLHGAFFQWWSIICGLPTTPHTHHTPHLAVWRSYIWMCLCGGDSNFAPRPIPRNSVGGAVSADHVDVVVVRCALGAQPAARRHNSASGVARALTPAHVAAHIRRPCLRPPSRDMQDRWCWMYPSKRPGCGAADAYIPHLVCAQGGSGQSR